MNDTTALGLAVSLVTSIGIVLTTYLTGRKDKDTIVKEVYEQRLILKDEIISGKDEEINELRVVNGWLNQKLLTKDEIIRGLFNHEIEAMMQARKLMQKGYESDSNETSS